MAERAWVENARHFFSALAKGPKDPLLAEDSAKMLHGIYLDVCLGLGLDPDDQSVSRACWTMALVGHQVQKSFYIRWLKEKNEEAQAGMTMGGMV